MTTHSTPEPEADTVYAAWEAARSSAAAPPDFTDRVMAAVERGSVAAPQGTLPRLLAHPIGRAALIAVAISACAFRVAQVVRLLMA